MHVRALVTAEDAQRVRAEMCAWTPPRGVSRAVLDEWQWILRSRVLNKDSDLMHWMHARARGRPTMNGGWRSREEAVRWRACCRCGPGTRPGPRSTACWRAGRAAARGPAWCGARWRSTTGTGAEIPACGWAPTRRPGASTPSWGSAPSPARAPSLPKYPWNRRQRPRRGLPVIRAGQTPWTCANSSNASCAWKPAAGAPWPCAGTSTLVSRQTSAFSKLYRFVNNMDVMIHLRTDYIMQVIPNP